MELPTDAFIAIEAELLRQPIARNEYRNKAGSGRSQAFGIVGKRSLPPNYSRQNWCRPYLYKLLLDFGAKYVDISFNSITINQDFKADRHRDKNNSGPSYLVAFGDYEGGELVIHEGDLSGCHNICRKPIVTDFSKVDHSVNAFTGHRYSLVFYTYYNKRSVSLPPWELKEDDGKWYFYCNGEKLTPGHGLPHPLAGRSKKDMKPSITVEKRDITIDFS